MAKLGGNIGPLEDFRVLFSLTEGGRIYDLSSSLAFQQSIKDPAETVTGLNFPLPIAGAVNLTSPFTGKFASTTRCLAAGSSSNVKQVIPVVSDYLSFTTKELTFSVWVSGSTVSPSISSTSSSYVIQTSGSAGLQFNLARWDAGPSKATFILDTMTGSALPGQVFVIASTTKTAGLSGAVISGSGAQLSYRGRYFPVGQPPTGSQVYYPASLSGWHHIVYVQRAAERPRKVNMSSVLGAEVSPLFNTSETGQEGLCEMWLDGELVYTTPAWGPFPAGHSPFFYEDGLLGLQGDNTPRYPTTELLNKTLRQPIVNTFFSGSLSNGDAIAQLAVWNRVLSGPEIKAIYKGVIDGVYTERRTSYTSAPKRLLGLVDRKKSKNAANSGFYDSSPVSKLAAFVDSSTISTSEVYQENFLAPEVNVGFSDGNLLVDHERTPAFSDAADLTSPVIDDEYVIASGSALIRVPLPNEDTNTIAARFDYSGWSLGAPELSTVLLLDGSSDFIGTGFLYYSPVLKKWIEKRYAAETSLTSDNNYTKISASASNFIRLEGNGYTGGLFQDGDIEQSSNKIMAQFAWSPQFGYFVNHVEHLRQAGYERIGWPTSMFGAPNAPRYHGFDHETIKLKNFIDRPFILKRIELRIPVTAERRFGLNPGIEPASVSVWNRQITNKKDLDNYVFFVYRQRRVSRERDTAADWSTSKRYLIASASICYYNSASFGGAWTDGFFTDATSKWQLLPSVSPYNSGGLYTGLTQPDSSIDFFSQSLTRISTDNAILHTPQYSKNWGVTRFLNPAAPSAADSQIYTDSRFLNLTMLPSMVPECQVAPSLIPITASSKRDFAYREGDFSTPPIRLYSYVSLGNHSQPTAATTAVAPGVTLLCNRWLGGTRPPLMAVTSLKNPYSSIQPDNFTTLTGPTPGWIDPGFPTGSVDAQLSMVPSYCRALVNLAGPSKPSEGTLSDMTWSAQRGTVQQFGLSFFPHDFYSAKTGVEQINKGSFLHESISDPQSINAGIPVGDTSAVRWFGRYTSVSAADEWSVAHGNLYMGYYGWRFISAFQVGTNSERQIYNPIVLEPEDELILGLDAGTFGPPDVDTDDLPGDGLLDGPTSGENRGGGLQYNGSNRVFKNTHLKEDYNQILPDSRLRIGTGEAEIVLIGDFVSSEKINLPKRSSPQQGAISSYYGEEIISDRSFLFNGELLSGSMYTRIYTGSEGPKGLIDGNTDPAAARRFYLDAGARRI